MLLEKVRTLDLSKYPEASVQKSLFTNAAYHQLPIAAWRLPYQEKQHVIIDLSGKVKQIPLELEALSPGFIVSPFLPESQPQQASYIHADLYYSTNDVVLRRKERTLPLSAQAEALLESIEASLAKPGALDKSPFTSPLPQAMHTSTRKDLFLRLVGQAVEAIEAGDFQKVVPSRKKIVQLPEGFDIVETFRKLCQAYPAAFISAFYIPGAGIWIGASPETLVSTYPQQETKIFRTVALAGTQVRKAKANLKDTAWRQKEIEEQAMVCRYIINCFKKIRLREFEEIGPKTVSAGDLLHLRTDYLVDMKATNFPELASVMLGLLHPTSAVCGMPKEPALSFLQQWEGYDREYFSGFLGPVNMETDELHIFVNLRCMQWLGDHAALYSGAGVTIDSDPIREWKETEAKMNTLLKVIL